MTMQRNKLYSLIPVIDLLFFVMMDLIIPYFSASSVLTLFSLVFYMTSLVVLGFYSDARVGKAKYIVNVLVFLTIFNFANIAVQYMVLFELVFGRLSLFYVNLLMLTYFYLRNKLVVAVTNNQVRTLYIVRNSSTEDLEQMIRKKTAKAKYWVYGGPVSANALFSEFSQKHNRSNRIAIIGNITDYSAQDADVILNMKIQGLKVYCYADFCEMYLEKVDVDSISDEWLISSRGFDSIFEGTYMRLKRVFDIVISLVGLVLALPILLVAAVIIKIDSKGPVLFFQQRTGKNGVPFTMYKLRTMVCGAETKEPVWTKENDIRITAVGSFLRKSRIDEIPQLFNVIKGDMSFIGPRPERPEFDQKLKKEIPYYMVRYVVKPGLTGWAQVNYGYGASVEDAKIKLKYDLYYIKNYSFYLDFRIIIRTLYIILCGKGK